MNTNTLRALEFDKIRTLLLWQTGSVEGRVRIESLEPLTDPARVREALKTTAEGVTLLRALGRQPYHDLPDLTETLAAARVSGSHLEPKFEQAYRGDFPKTLCQNNKARTLLRWSPQVDFETGVAEFLDWFKASQGLIRADTATAR